MGFGVDSSESMKIRNLREDLEGELLSLVEAVLLNKYGYSD